jgi:HEAT repeat protein
MNSLKLLFFLLAGLVSFQSDCGAEEGQGPVSGSDASLATDYTRDVGERIEAIRRMAQRGEAGQFKALRDILLDRAEEQGVRASAARALSEFRTDIPETLQAFSEVLKEPGADPNLRYAVLMSAGNLRDPLSINLLTDALSEKDSMARFKAVQALGELGEKGAVEIIVNHLTSERDKMVRAQAARALGRYNVEQSQRCLADLLRGDPEALVRLNAALSLRGFSSHITAAKEALEEASRDASPAVRDAAKGGRP